MSKTLQSIKIAQMLIVFIIVFIFALIITPYIEAQPQFISVTIESDGVVIVEMDINVDEGLNIITLPIEPIPESITVSLDRLTLIPMYVDESLYVFSPKSGTSKVTYFANISVKDNVFSFEIKDRSLVKLAISQNIILLSVPENIVGYSYVNESLILEFYGPQRIDYVIRIAVTSIYGQQITNETITTIYTEETEIASQPFKKVSIPSEEGTRFWEQHSLLISILVTVVALAIFITATLIKGYRRQKSISGLSNVDLEILKIIKEKGGSMAQGDLQTILRLPKTTLWRHVKKLEKLGYIKIVKEGPFNRLILIRDS